MRAAFSRSVSQLLPLGKFGLVTRQSIFICWKTVVSFPLHRPQAKPSWASMKPWKGCPNWTLTVSWHEQFNGKDPLLGFFAWAGRLSV
jgi:hypothetical protein